MKISPSCVASLFKQCYRGSSADGAESRARHPGSTSATQHPLSTRAHRSATSESGGSSSEAASRMAPRAKLSKGQNSWTGAIPFIIRAIKKRGGNRVDTPPLQAGTGSLQTPVEPQSPGSLTRQEVPGQPLWTTLSPHTNQRRAQAMQAQREGTAVMNNLSGHAVPAQASETASRPQQLDASVDLTGQAIDPVAGATPLVQTQHTRSSRTLRPGSSGEQERSGASTITYADVAPRARQAGSDSRSNNRSVRALLSQDPSTRVVRQSQTVLPISEVIVGTREDQLSPSRDGRSGNGPVGATSRRPFEWPPNVQLADIPLHRRDHRDRDIESQVSRRSPMQSSFGSSLEGTARAVVNQLSMAAQSALPLQGVLSRLREEPPIEAPATLAARLSQRFDLYVQRDVQRPLDMPLMLECVKERERQLALPKPQQNWDKAVELYKKACKLDLAHVEKGWQSAGSIYPLSAIPAGALALLPSLASMPFSSLQPLTGAWVNVGLQVGLAMVTPALTAGFQNFFINLQELKRVGGLSHRSPALAGASAPEFGTATQNIQKALGEIDAALIALQDENAGPAEAERAVKAEKQLMAAAQAYERRVDVNNLNYTGQHWQNYTRSARQAAYFLAPVVGNYVKASADSRRYITYGLQVAATVGQWIVQQFAARQDERNKQETTILATLKHTEVRKPSAIASKVAADDLTEEHIDLRKFRDQWRSQEKVRLMSVTDILLNGIDGHLSSAARLVGLTSQDWVTLQGLESRRHDSPEPLDSAGFARLVEIRQQPCESMSRGELLEWMRLEERAREPLNEAEEQQLGALEKKFATSTMSEHAWGRLQEVASKFRADPNSLTWSEHEELEQLRERAAASLTVAEHALLETLKIRRKFSPAAKDIATRSTLEAKAGLSESERAVLTRASRAQGSEVLPASAEDFRAMGAIRRKLHDKLSDTEMVAHSDALSRISTGLTANEKKQYVELRNKGRFNELDAHEQAQLRELKQQVQELRLDRQLLTWDWSKLSEGTQRVMDSALSGASDLQFAWQTTKARLGRRQEFTPELAQRYGSAFQLVVGGSSMPFIVGAGFRLASAMGKNMSFEAVRLPAGLVTLAIGVIGAWASGALINFKITDRNRLRKLSEEAPSTTQLLLSSIPRAMFALPAEIKQLRHSAKVAADGEQWLARQGRHLQLAIRHATQRTNMQQVPNQAATSTSGSGPDLMRSDDWLRAMDNLLAETADVQRRAFELRTRLPEAAAQTAHRSARHSLPV